MLNFRQLRTNFILILLVLTLTGCAEIKFLLNTAKLTDEIASKIQTEIDEKIDEKIEFANVVLIDDQTGKSILLTRTEREEDGSLRYVTKPISWPVPVKEVKKISSHSVLVATIGEKNNLDDLPHCHNIGHSVCNLINLNDVTGLLCKEDEEIFTKNRNFSNGYDHVAQEASSIDEAFIDVVSAPDQLFDDLEKLGGNRVKSISFTIIQDITTGKKILLKRDKFKIVSNSHILRGCVDQLDASYGRYDFTFKGSCAVGQSDGGGDGTISKSRRC